MMRLWISLLFLLLSLSSIHANDEYIQSQIYTKFPGVKSCFRLMHRKGQIGCSTPPSGLIGTLRLLTSQDTFDAIISKPPSHQVAAVITQEQFSQKNIQRLKESVHLAGLLILKSSPPATGFSSEVHNPPAYFDSPSITLPENDGDIFKWNPLGDGMSYQEFPFGIVQVQDDHSVLLQQRAQWNEDKIRNNEHPAQTIQFNYRMYGEKDSYTCLADSRCIPVGGYSVWSPFGGRLNTSIPRPIVMAIAPMDSSAFFHEMAYGGDSTASGLAALLGAAAALGNVQNVSLLNSSIIFAAFNAETWSQSGSRKFVRDIQSFHCQLIAGSNSCYQPYQTSLDFTKFNVTNITRIIELNQIGLNTTVFMHRDKTLNAETEALMRDLVNTTINMTNAGITDFRIAPTSDNLGLPPSSSQAFIAANPAIGTIVLTDHEREYANKYYHSRFDDVSNVQNKLRYYPHLCNVATLTARTLYLSAGGNTSMAQTIKADCEMISKLYLCLMEDMKCDFVKQFTSSGGGKNPTKYSGVYQLQQRRFIGGIPRFVYEFLGAYSQNTTAEQKFGYVWFHDAVDPAFVFDYDKGMWSVNETVGKPSMLWTESNWDTDVGIRLFMTESSNMEIGMILAGIGIFLSTAFFLWRSKKWCAFHYKAI